MPLPIQPILSLFLSYQDLADACAERGDTLPDELDAHMGTLEHLLASAEVVDAQDLHAKSLFLRSYRNDRTMIPEQALDTLVAGVERVCGLKASAPAPRAVAA